MYIVKTLSWNLKVKYKKIKFLYDKNGKSEIKFLPLAKME